LSVDWLRRRWFDLALLVGLVVATVAAIDWRQQQFEGHGLRGAYYARADWKGRPFMTRVDPFIDFSDADDPVYDRDRFTVEWTGTLVAPRDGLYRFALESDDGSTLEINGQVVIDNGGVHAKKRMDGHRQLKKGPHAIRLRYLQAGAGGMIRLYWKPFGRRGDLEYVPPTVLYPVDPDEAKIAGARAIPPRDLATVTIVAALLLLASLLWLRRPLWGWIGQLRRQRIVRIDALLILILIGAALLVRLWDLGAAGQTWDEDIYWSAGRDYIQNFLAGDFRPESWAWNQEHPALAKWIYGPATLVSEDYGPARYLSAVLGALTCALVFIAGRDLINRRVGFLGAGFCLVLPHIIAHNKIVGLETPSGLFYTLGLLLFFRALRRGGNSGYYLAAGLVAGLALAVRLTNLSLVALMVLLYLLTHWRQIRQERAFPVSISLGLAPVVMGLTFFASWPYLWDNPMQHLGEMLSHWKPDIYLEYFLGEKQESPFYYYPLYFAVTTPVALLPAVLVGIARSAVRRDRGQITLLLWFLAPFMIMLSPMARDGVRYLYPALIAGCLLAAAGVDWIAEGIGRLVRRPALAVPAVALLGAVLGLYVLRCGLSVHPYYLDYYNEAVGGPAYVKHKRWFEIGWWGEGLLEAGAYVNRAADQGASVNVYAHPAHVVKLRPDLKRVHTMDADFVIYNDLFNTMPKKHNLRLGYVVRAAGAPLVWVYQREGAADTL
jgi:4-amino-4-deoxy-L-arabinose transferase-like glycosyltransferase